MTSKNSVIRSGTHARDDGTSVAHTTTPVIGGDRDRCPLGATGAVISELWLALRASVSVD